MQSDELADDELVAAVATGDRRVARQLYDRLIRTVEATIHRVLGARGDDHADLVQAAFEQIIRALAGRRFEGTSSLTSWATAVTAHVAFSALRRRVREKRTFAREVDAARCPDETDVEAEVHARRQMAAVRAELGSIRPTAATILFLFDGMGHSLAEIAAQLCMSPAATQSQLVRARRRLRRRLLALEAKGRAR